MNRTDMIAAVDHAREVIDRHADLVAQGFDVAAGTKVTLASALLAAEAECEKLREEKARDAWAMPRRDILAQRDEAIEHAQNVECMNVVFEDRLREAERAHAQAVTDLQATALELEEKCAAYGAIRESFVATADKLQADNARLRAEVERVTAVAERILRWAASLRGDFERGSPDTAIAISRHVAQANLSDLRGAPVSLEEAEAWLRGGAK